jgi:hypothetical protein
MGERLTQLRCASCSYIMLDATVGALGFYVLGYGFAYGDRYECAAPATRRTGCACGASLLRGCTLARPAAGADARDPQLQRRQPGQRFHRQPVLRAVACVPERASRPPALDRPAHAARVHAAGLPYAKGASKFYDWRVPAWAHAASTRLAGRRR